MNMHFANLSSPIWDGIRIPRRRTAAEIADEMCARVGLDREVVRRNVRHGSNGAPPAVKRLQGEIAVAILDSGLPSRQVHTWFLGFETTSILRMAVECRRRRREGGE